MSFCTPLLGNVLFEKDICRIVLLRLRNFFVYVVDQDFSLITSVLRM